MVNTLMNIPPRVKGELERSLEEEGWKFFTNIEVEQLPKKMLFYDPQYRYLRFSGLPKHPETIVVEEAYESDGVTRIRGYVALYVRE